MTLYVKSLGFLVFGGLMSGFDSEHKVNAIKQYKPTKATMEQAFPSRPEPSVPLKALPQKSLYWFHKGQDHFVSSNAAEGPSAGYTLILEFQVFAQEFAGSKAIYRCFDPTNGNHFVSLQDNCEGHRTEGALGYVAINSTPSVTRPLVRCATDTHHLVAPENATCQTYGIQLELTLGHILKPS